MKSAHISTAPAKTAVVNSRAGFTLVEILMVIALLGILTVLSLTAMDRISSDAAFDKTYQRMILIKTALVGDLDANKQGLRDYYGYLGDVGGLPSTSQGLQALLSQPENVPTWGIDSTAKTGMGWRGPYLKSTTGIDWLHDAWGNAFIYNTSGTPYIMSYGSDGAVGGTGSASDIEIDLGTNITFASVFGVINTAGARYQSAAAIDLYAPDGNGTLTTRSTTIAASDNGYFSFTNVPFGLRSVKVSIENSGGDIIDTIGPAILSIDNPNYQIPHNYLDSSPGALPHTCSNVNNVQYVALSKDTSATTNRVYFQLDITQAMTIQTIFLQLANNATFRGMRIGNDTKNCDGGAADGFKCMSYNFLNLFGDEDTSAPYETDPAHFPEINLSVPWTIESGDKVGAYIELSDVSGLNWVELRLACNLLRIE